MVVGGGSGGSGGSGRRVAKYGVRTSRAVQTEAKKYRGEREVLYLARSTAFSRIT